LCGTNGERLFAHNFWKDRHDIYFVKTTIPQ
jgi:hypothetical protein